MLIKPVYLLAPEPDTRIKLSRRAFFGFVAGGISASVGVGFWWGRSSNPAPPPTDNSPSPQLVWARALAQDGIDGLFDNAEGFLTAASKWPHEESLQSGLRRLTLYVVAAPTDDPRADQVAWMLLACLRRWNGNEEPIRKLTARLGR